MKKNILFLENFAELLNQGYTVEQSLSLSHQILYLPFYDYYMNALSQGEDIYELLLEGDYPSTFKNYLNFYKNKGHLSEAIINSLKICKKQDEFINKLRKQLTYPMFLLLFLFGFSLFVLVFLLPQVHILFESFSIEMNYMTYIMFLLFQLFPYVFTVLFCFITITFMLLIYGIKKKRYKILDKFINIPILNVILKKYFSLKFAIFYNELSLDNIDTASIIELLNEQMADDDIKVILYEMKNLIKKGENMEDILTKLKYLDPLLQSFFQISFYNINKKDAISFYIDLTYSFVELYIDKFIKVIIPVVYCFVSFFVIGIYVAVIMPLMSGFSNI